MLNNHLAYLKELQAAALEHDVQQFYLWPRTPIMSDLQEEIIQRVGVSDFDVSNTSSRSSQIIRLIRALLTDRLITDDFSILDFPCGDAIVLWQIKKAFPLAHCYGLDCNKGTFFTHHMVQRDGVVLYRAFLQQLFVTNPKNPFDLAVMLNTYRGWEFADLRDHERNLPSLADAWFARSAKYTVLTATDTQREQLRGLRFSAIEIGKGEDDSKMICISRSRLPVRGFV